MERDMVAGQPEKVEELAMELLYQGERYAMAGLLQQAEALLAQAWTLAEGHAGDLADSAAWEAGWLLVRMGSYEEATEWFGRVAAPPTNGSRLWPDAREALIEICQALAHGPAAPAAPLAPPARTGPVSPPARADKPLPPLQVANLGRFQVGRADKPLPACKARKAIAILRYLLAQRQHAARKEELMEVLWPDAHPHESAHSLHVAVSALRRYLDPQDGSYVLFEAGTYLINPEAHVEDDCSAFTQLCDEAEQRRRAGDLPAAQRAYSRAVACYQGDYYVDDRDVAWAIAERERLLARFLSALECMGRICLAQEQFEPAIDHYQRLLDRDGYREDIHCQLMLCYQRLGRRREALQQYERCAAILANDLGLEPMPEIQALYHSILHAEGKG